jgi:hypothetical protein
MQDSRSPDLTKGQYSDHIGEEGVLEEPLHEATAKKVATEIIRTGKVAFTEHALGKMAKHGLDRTDCIRVIKSGSCGPPEYEGHSWRYRFCAAKTVVVIAFHSATHLAVVTTWEKRP